MPRSAIAHSGSSLLATVTYEVGPRSRRRAALVDREHRPQNRATQGAEAVRRHRSRPVLSRAGGSSPLPEMRTASSPAASSGPCTPTPRGNASRIICPGAALECGSRPSSSLSDVAAVRSSPTPTRWESFDQAWIRAAPAAPASPGRTARSRPRPVCGRAAWRAGAGRRARRACAPSTDASTSVLCDGVPWSTRAISVERRRVGRAAGGVGHRGRRRAAPSPRSGAATRRPAGRSRSRASLPSPR